MIKRTQCQLLSHIFVWLAEWLWLALLIFSSSHASSLSLPSLQPSDRPPRAALVTLANEDDLEPLLSSIYQLEDAFNRRFHYDWVFFSTEPLSDKFRQMTSNATSSTCVYELVKQGAVELKRLSNCCPEQDEATKTLRDAQITVRGQLQSPRQIRRWSNGPFAQESRLQTYDWFWRIEPGVSGQF